MPMLEPAIENLIEASEKMELRDGETQPAIVILKHPATAKAMLQIVALNELGKVVRIIDQDELIPLLTELLNTKEE